MVGWCAIVDLPDPAVGGLVVELSGWLADGCAIVDVPDCSVPAGQSFQRQRGRGGTGHTSAKALTEIQCAP